MDLEEAIANAKEISENQCVNDRCRENLKQLAAWLEELKQYREENQAAIKGMETNLDHFNHEILEDCIWNLAVVKGKPKRCNYTNCRDCEFNKDSPRECHKRAVEWLKKPYIKPTYKLTKFENDLLQGFIGTYKFKFKDVKPLTRMKEKGYFKGIDKDATIEDILANCEVTEED